MTTRRHDFDIHAYTQRARQSSCFICDIVSGADDHPRQIIYRDDFAIAFFNRYPTLVGYCLVAPLEHREAVLDDFTETEYVELQRVIRRVGRALSAVVPTERLYILSLGSQQGNSHVHWHVAPLPPDVPYEDQQFRSLMVETAGYFDMSTEEGERLASRIRQSLANRAQPTPSHYVPTARYTA